MIVKHPAESFGDSHECISVYRAKCWVKRNVVSDVVFVMHWILHIKPDVVSMKRKLRFQVVAANSKTHRHTLAFIIWMIKTVRFPILTGERCEKLHRVVTRLSEMSRWTDSIKEFVNLIFNSHTYIFFFIVISISTAFHRIRSKSFELSYISDKSRICSLPSPGHRTESTINWTCKKRFN